VGLATRYYSLSECCCLKFAVFYLWGALSDERTRDILTVILLIDICFLRVLDDLIKCSAFSDYVLMFKKFEFMDFVYLPEF
jgi:hypothetical protein